MSSSSIFIGNINLIFAPLCNYLLPFLQMNHIKKFVCTRYYSPYKYAYLHQVYNLNHVNIRDAHKMGKSGKVVAMWPTTPESGIDRPQRLISALTKSQGYSATRFSKKTKSNFFLIEQ